MIYPLPAVLVSCGATPEEYNMLTVAWTGTICSDPAMCYISVRPERHSYDIIRRTGEFVINLTTEALARATDWCGVKSGRDVNKWQEMGLKPVPATVVNAPLIEESPVSIECRVKQIIPLGTHDMFIAEVVNVVVDEQYLDEKGKFDMVRAGLMAYSHGEYFTLGRSLGHFGWSVRKRGKKRSSRPKRLLVRHSYRKYGLCDDSHSPYSVFGGVARLSCRAIPRNLSLQDQCTNLPAHRYSSP